MKPSVAPATAVMGATGTVKAGSSKLPRGFEGPGISFPKGLSASHLKWWNDSLDLTPRGLARDLTQGALEPLGATRFTAEFEVHERPEAEAGSPPVVSTKINFETAQGTPAATMKVDIDHVRMWTNVDLIEVYGDHAGKGVGKRLKDNVIGLTRDVGFATVRVRAKFEVGPYFWAAQGFVPEEAEWQSNIRPKLEDQIGELRTQHPALVDGEVEGRVRALLLRTDPDALVEVAQLKEPRLPSPNQPDRTVSLGQALLSIESLNYEAYLKL